MDAVDVDDCEWAGAAFGVRARVLIVVPKLNVVTSVSKATLLEESASP